MMDTARTQNHDELDDELIVDRLMGAAVMAPMVPQRIIVSLVGSGVLERFPDLHFLLVEFNANWLVSTMAAMDKAWTLGVGQHRDWWAGTWDDDRPADDQPGMAQLFHLNERWPYPLMPSEYVQRQIHVSFQEDPMAIACRHLTGVSTLVWGADYPHAEGTFTHTREAIEHQFRDVEPEDRDAILGGTLGGAARGGSRMTMTTSDRSLLRPVRPRHRRRPLPRVPAPPRRGTALLQRAPRLLRRQPGR